MSRIRTIKYAEDVNKIDLDDLRSVEGIGEAALTRFFSAVLRHNLYTDSESLQRFLLDKRVHIEPWGISDAVKVNVRVQICLHIPGAQRIAVVA